MKIMSNVSVVSYITETICNLRMRNTNSHSPSPTPQPGFRLISHLWRKHTTTLLLVITHKINIFNPSIFWENLMQETLSITTVFTTTVSMTRYSWKTKHFGGREVNNSLNYKDIVCLVPNVPFCKKTNTFVLL